MDEHVMRALEQVIQGRVGGLHPLAIPPLPHSTPTIRQSSDRVSACRDAFGLGSIVMP